MDTLRIRCAPTYTPEALTTTLWFHECCRIMARIAHVLNQADRACLYAEWAGRLSTAFQEKFYDRERRTFGSQTANAMALHFGLVPAGETPAVVENLARDLRDTDQLPASLACATCSRC